MGDTFNRQQEDLSFLFQQSEAAIGLSSNFLSCIRQLQLGGYSSVTEANYELQFDNQTMTHIAKHRRILHIYQRLSPQSKLILDAYYSESPNPTPIRVYYNLHYKLLALTPLAKAQPNPVQAVAFSLLRKKGKLSAPKLKEQAIQLYRQAVQEYAEIERSLPKPKSTSAFHPGLK
jgi:hypothetical protein